MRDTIKRFVKSCELCKQNKHHVGVQQHAIKTSTPIKTFDVVSIDTIGPFSITEQGNRYAVTMQCDLSKYMVLVPIPDKSAQTIARAVIEKCILIYGPMSAIKTDQGTEYKGVFDNVCELLKIDHVCATAYHPQTIGALERNHRCLNEYLRSFVNEHRNDWDEWLSFYSFSYNTTSSTYHEYSPFEIVFGKPLKKFENIDVKQVDPVYNTESYTKELKFKLQTIQKHVFDKIEHEKIRRTQEANKSINQTNLKQNDVVYLKTEGNKKLGTVNSGPYKIASLDESNATIIHQQTNQELTVHKNRLVYFRN